MEKVRELQILPGSVFSLRQDWNHLFNRPAFQEPVIDGVRAIAILWVMVLHMVSYQLAFFPSQGAKIFKMSATSWIQNGGQGVDLFFTISGFLMGSILLAERKASGSIDFSRFYVRRFLRLVPVYVAAMLLALYLLHNLPGYPSWNNAQYSWANLLYVNNFLPFSKQYMNWCWSLAIEEQFYVVLPGFLLLFLGWGRGRIRILGFLLCLSVAIRFGVIHFSGIVPPFRFTPASWSVFFDTIYDKPWMRFGGLLAGVSAAYLNIYFPEQVRRFFARTGVVTALSLLSLAAIRLIASTALDAVFFDHLPYRARELWWAFHRDVLSVSAMFLILAAIHTPRLFGGWLRRLLSAKVFYPIAQLSYSFYLVHEMVFQWLFPRIAPVLQLYLQPSRAMAADSIAGFAIASLIAIALYMTIERPSMRLRTSKAVLQFIASFDKRREQQLNTAETVQG